jgi:hypothetical protein
MIMNNLYTQKVEILLKIIPIVADEECFAIHGGTAINLFVNNLPRYSIDIDLTYIPLEDRNTSIANINNRLVAIAERTKKSLKGVNVIHRPDSCKLLCEYRGKRIKIEVNQTKRGIVGGSIVTLPLCEKAQEQFGLYCEANIVPLSLLYGGKIAAALSRQHPRDLFDVKYMNVDLYSIKPGIIFCLLSSDRPMRESFAPNLIDRRDAMVNQFVGMTDVEFDYSEFEETRWNLIKSINGMLSDEDKSFLIAFESGEPNWEASEYDTFKNYPSVQWKQLNIQKLKKSNPAKWQEEIEKLKQVLNIKELIGTTM